MQDENLYSRKRGFMSSARKPKFTFSKYQNYACFTDTLLHFKRADLIKYYCNYSGTFILKRFDLMAIVYSRMCIR